MIVLELRPALVRRVLLAAVLRTSASAPDRGIYRGIGPSYVRGVRD
jgi:hypothetical protein